MKKIIYISLVLGFALSLSSCVNEEENLFEDSAAERLNKIKENYSQSLWRSPYGWAMQYYPTYDKSAPKGCGYLLLCDFNEDHSVKVSMMEDVATVSGNPNPVYRTDTSAWDITTDNGPVLSFSTYNTVLHKFSDPSYLEGGTGYEGDYEFIIVDAPEDASMMMLKGKKRGTYTLLTPLEEEVDFEEYLKDVVNMHYTLFPVKVPTYNVMNFGNTKYKMEGADDGVPNIYPFEGDRVIDESFNPFLLTKRTDGYYLRFRDKIKLSDEESVQDFRYDQELDKFISVDNSAYVITGDSPSRFFDQTFNWTIAQNWKFTRASVASDDMQAIIGNVYTQLRANRQNLKHFELRRSDDYIALAVLYGTTSCEYLFTRTLDGDNIVFNYVEPKNSQATNLLKVVPAIQDLINAFNGKTFFLKGVKTNFDLNNVQIQSGDSYLNLEYIYNFADLTDMLEL